MMWGSACIIMVAHRDYGSRLQSTSSVEPSENELREFIEKYPDVSHLDTCDVYVYTLSQKHSVADLKRG